MSILNSRSGLLLTGLCALVLTGCGGGSAAEPATPGTGPVVNQSSEAGGNAPAVVASTAGTRGVVSPPPANGESGGDGENDTSNSGDSEAPETCSSGGGRGGDVCGAGDTDGEQ